MIIANILLENKLCKIKKSNEKQFFTVNKFYYLLIENYNILRTYLNDFNFKLGFDLHFLINIFE